MGTETRIGWTDHTFNPWWGCERVSPGCQHCYAEAFAKRTGNQVWGKTADRRMFGDKHWREPLRWDDAAARAGRRALVFCASMADVFEDRDDLLEARARLFDTIDNTPNLIWQLLTKRPENVIRLTAEWLIDPAIGTNWPTNVWIGTTVEDQARADLRIPALREIPAPVRFLSCEPLLEAIDLSRWLGLEWMDALRAPGAPMSFRGEGGWGAEMFAALAGRRPAVDWIIVGGESGAGHRPMQSDHAMDLCAQVLAAEIPLYFKQWGGRTPTAGGNLIDVYGDGDTRTWTQFPDEANR